MLDKKWKQPKCLQLKRLFDDLLKDICKRMMVQAYDLDGYTTYHANLFVRVGEAGLVVEVGDWHEIIEP